jgi:hypothetical protein
MLTQEQAKGGTDLVEERRPDILPSLGIVEIRIKPECMWKMLYSI